MDAKKTNQTKTTKRNARPTGTEAAAWLKAKSNGRPRVQVLGWMALARLWLANRPGSAVRRLIAAECRRLGYTPTTILGLHAE